MATLTIRQLDDEVYARLKLQAVENHRSVEAEARFQLGERTAPRISLAERLRASQMPSHPDYPGSVAAIRSVRDGE